jgi:hypothetical protein
LPKEKRSGRVENEGSEKFGRIVMIFLPSIHETNSHNQREQPEHKRGVLLAFAQEGIFSFEGVPKAKGRERGAENQIENVKRIDVGSRR